MRRHGVRGARTCRSVIRPYVLASVSAGGRISRDGTHADENFVNLEIFRSIND